jgi:hypothetical protein
MTAKMKRREFITLVGGAAVGWPLAAPLKSFAQQHSGKLPRIGWLVPTTQAEWDSLLEEYRRGMLALGYKEATPPPRRQASLRIRFATEVLARSTCAPAPLQSARGRRHAARPVARGVGNSRRPPTAHAVDRFLIGSTALPR